MEQVKSALYGAYDRAREVAQNTVGEARDVPNRVNRFVRSNGILDTLSAEQKDDVSYEVESMRKLRENQTEHDLFEHPDTAKISRRVAEAKASSLLKDDVYGGGHEEMVMLLVQIVMVLTIIILLYLLVTIVNNHGCVKPVPRKKTRRV